MTQRRPAFRRFRTWFLIAAILSGGLAAWIMLRPPSPHTAYLVIDAEGDVSFIDVNFEGVAYYPLPVAGLTNAGTFIVEKMESRSRQPDLEVSWTTQSRERRSLRMTFEWAGEFWFCVMLLRIGAEGEVRPSPAGDLVKRTCGYGK